MVACGGDDSSDLTPGDDAGTLSDANAPVLDATTSDVGPDTLVDAPADAADAGSVDRGPTTLAFAGDPSGLYWAYGAKAALYIADDRNNRIATWADVGGFTAGWALPPSNDPDGGGAGLGQVVRQLDGTLIVTRAGVDGGGSVLVVDATGDAGTQNALNAARRRNGLGFLIDGTLVDSYSLGGTGVIAKLAISPDGGKETTLASGFTQPLGVVLNEGNLFVTDPGLGALLRFSSTDGGVFVNPDAGVDAGDLDGGDAGDAGDAAAPVPSVVIVTALDSPTLLAQGADGDLFAGSTSGNVYRITRAGVVSNLATGLKEVRGVAYDGAHRRLFVAEHDPAGLANAIHIYPVP